MALKYGPDGGVYVTDWTDLGECHDNDGVHRLDMALWAFETALAAQGEKPLGPVKAVSAHGAKCYFDDIQEWPDTLQVSYEYEVDDEPGRILTYEMRIWTPYKYMGESEVNDANDAEPVEAEAEKTRREAKGQADAVLMKYEAEAEGVQKVLAAKAAGGMRPSDPCGRTSL